MTKQIKKTGKRSLAVLMTILMLMTSWVFVAPSASAATAGNYTVVVYFNVTGETESKACEEDYIEIWYKPNNGTGTETSQKFDKTGAGEFNSTGSKSFTFTVAGWPTKVKFSINQQWYWAGIIRRYNDLVLKWTSWTVQGQTAWSGSEELDSSVNEKHAEKSNSLNAPKASSISDISGDDTVYVSTTNTTVTKSYTLGTVKDQYGVNWYQDATWGTATVSNGVTFSNGTLTVPASSNRANDYTVTLLEQRGDASNTKTVTIKTFDYKVTFYDENGTTVLKNTQTVNYGASATAPANPSKAYDNDKHYAFAGWTGDGYTNITSGAQTKTVKASYTGTNHNYNQQVTTSTYFKSAATCENKAVYYYSCTCGKKGTTTFETGNALGHDFGTGTTRIHDRGDGTHDWKCSRCETYGKVENGQQVKGGYVSCTYGNWTADTATCESTGTHSRTCSACGHTDTQNTPSLGHSYTTQTVGANYLYKAATCTEAAKYYYSCSRCGKSENDPDHTFSNGNPLGHSFTGAAHNAGSGVHNYQCARCDVYGVGTTANATEACSGGTATCAAKAVCDICHTEYGDKAPNAHTNLTHTARVENTCQQAGNIEYWYCSGCGKYFSDAAATSEITQVDTILAKKDHSYTGAVRCNNDGTHSFKCVNGCDQFGGTVSCEATYGEPVIDPTPNCTTAGKSTRVCAVCGYNEVTTLDPDLTKHDWSAWTQVNAPTCTEKGSEKRICQREGCGVEESRDIDPLGHDWEADFTVDTQPTCTEAGQKSIHCARCDEKKDVTVIQALGHDWGEWERTTEPGCETKGQDTRTCARCGATETRDVDPLGHSWKTEWTIDQEPDCTHAGSKSHHCARCDAKTDVTTIDPLGHDWGAWSTKTPATCLVAGVKEHTCNRCGLTEEGTIEKLEHSYTGAVKDNNDGTHSFKCVNGCDQYGATVSCEATYGDWSADTATCTVQGEQQRECSVCGHVDKKTTPLKPHDYSVATVSEDRLAYPANCTQPAKYYYSCSMCGESENNSGHLFEDGEPLGHDWTGEPTYIWMNNNHVVRATLVCQRDGGHIITEDVETVVSTTKEATCTETGIATYTATFTNDPTKNDYNYTTNFTVQTTTSEVDMKPHTYVYHDPVAADCKTTGMKEYWTCSVCNQNFYREDGEANLKVLADLSTLVTPVDPTTHVWGDWTDNDNGTHSRVCERDASHVETETCVYEEIPHADYLIGQADCTKPMTFYKSCPVCGHASTETFTYDIDDVGHKLVEISPREATCTTAGNSQYWECAVCGKFFDDENGNHEIEENSWVIPAGHKMPLTHHEATVATCVTAGNSEYYECSVCGKYFSDAEGTQPIADKSSVIVQPSGHNWGTTPAWYWVKNGDSYDVTAVFTCTRDTSHKQNITATVTPDAANHPATCEEDGASTWNAVATFNGVDYTDSKSETTPAIGHKYIHVKEDSWVWTESDGAYTVKVTLVCDNDSTHEIERDALVSYTTDAPNCTTPGTRHYTAAVALDNGTIVTDTKDSVVPVVGHSMVATAKKDATCDEAGYEAYWTCSVCGKLFSDANGEHEITAPVVINAKGHAWGTPEYSWEKRGNDYYVTATVTCTTDTRHVVTETVKAVGEQTKAPTCTEKGETTYTATFTKEQFSTQTKDVQNIPTVAHTLTKTEAVEATCTVEGFDAYWTCSECGKIFSDENGDHEISEVTKALDPDNHKALVHTAKVDATCQANGNIEYWTCNDCHQKLVYNDSGKLVEVTDVVIPMGPAHHRFTTHVSEKDATCTQQGNVEYWTCSVCGKHFDGNTESANELTNVSTAPLGHDVTRTAAVAPTCTTDGNKEYWYCARCHQYFLADSITAEPVAFSATVDPKKGHTAVSVDAVAVQCEADGNKAYSYCSVCDTILTLDGVDVSLNGWTKSGNANVYTITQTGHAYGDPTWTWNDDHTSATATRICANDPTHTDTMTDNEIHSVIVDKTHTTDGKATYTAEVTFAYDNKTFTDVVEIVDTASGHHTTKVDAKDATCEAAGNLEYWICNDEGCGKLFKDENALVETTLDAVTLEALGHNYVNPTWTWTQNGNFYTGATLTFTCANNAAHKQTPAVTFTADQTNPDCTNAGKIVYTATATFEGKTYTDTKEVALEKTGHTLTATAAKNATCEEAGNIAYWTCSVCNKIFSDENARYEITAADTVIAALGHTYNYANASYNWSTDHSSCTATATCIRCDATDTETKASTNNVKIPATCEAQGIRIYTVDFDNENFATQTYDELIPANGHGTAAMHEGKAATCEAAGFEAYWTCSVCGKLFKAETLTAENEIANPIVIPAKGHDWNYETVVYTWSETEPYTCTATVTCKNDGNHTKDVTSSVTITASTEADCTTDGSRTYTATFPADSNIPTDTKTATTPALGHDFSESIDRAHVVDGTHHNYKCVRCNAYGIGTGESAEVNGSVACTFHGDWLVSENETCTEPGSEWRKCGFCSNKETREREALSHQVFSVDAKDATCVAIGNKAYTYCERCGLLLTVDGVSVEEQNIKFNAPEAIALYKTEDMLNHDLTATAAKAATCEEDGNIAYWTCERCGKIFNTATPTSNEAAIALVDTVLPATKHDFTGAVRDNDDNTHSKKCTKCDAYGIMVNGTPVKDGKEACYGGTATCTDAAICSVCGHAYQAKLGHNYVLQSWTWNGYTAATAHYVCTNNTTHTKDVEATVNKTDATVTCTAAGQNTYVATATFTDGDKTYTDTDTKTEVVNATGHNWDFEHPVYSWDANQNCTVTLKCLNDEDHVYTEIGKNTTETTPATCEGTGSVKYTATFTINSTLTSTHTETLAALGHKWGDPAWTWTGNDTDGYTATVKLVCDRVASHEATPDVTVTKETVAPTCEKDGRIVYTATATLDGRTYKDTKITIQPAKGHDWQAPVFTWTQAENGGYSAATALIACNNDPAHNQTLNCALTTETDNATCTEGGIVTYTATVTFNGRTYTETKTAEVTALGHKYEFVDFTWTGNDNDGYTAAVANFKCANDPTHTTTAAATVTTEKVDAICEADGKTTYTATVSFEGKDYTDEKVVVIPMLHHNWGTATYTWVKDGDQYKVTALRVCANNPEEHQQTVTVTTTSEILSGSGCETEGTVKYTATFASPFETQTREETVGVAGHTLVHVERKEPACEAAGNIEYWKCSVCGKMFDNDTGTGLTLDENAIAIPALGHNFVMAKGVAVLKANNDDLTHSFKCSRCDAYGAVINGEHKTEAEGGKMTHSYGAAIVTQNPTCTVPGEQQETCTLCGYVHTAVIEKTSHVLFKIDAKSPTCTKEGNKTYYYCSVCGQFFSDKDGQNPTSKEAMTIAKLGHDYTGAYHDNGDGTHSRACVNGCGTYGEKSAHTFDEAQSAATLCSVATCTKPATYYKSCSICGAKDSTVFTAGTALGHKMIAFTGQDASCTQDGHTAYTECERCHLREGYNVLKSTGHGAYQYNAEKSGSTADGSLKWSCYVCENGCGDYYMTLTVTSIDAQGTRVPNVNVSIYNADRSVNIQGTTDGNGDFVVPNEIRNRLKTGTYTVALEYVRDGSNYNTSGTIKVANGTITGSYGKLTPYGGNASGSIGGEPTGEFRCSMCSTYESAKNVPVYGWFISIIHFFVHMISRIGK